MLVQIATTWTYDLSPGAVEISSSSKSQRTARARMRSVLSGTYLAYQARILPSSFLNPGLARGRLLKRHWLNNPDYHVPRRRYHVMSSMGNEPITAFPQSLPKLVEACPIARCKAHIRASSWLSLQGKRRCNDWDDRDSPNHKKLDSPQTPKQSKLTLRFHPILSSL